VGVEQQEVDYVRNEWTGLFEPFEQPGFVESILRHQNPPATSDAGPDPKPERKRIDQQPAKRWPRGRIEQSEYARKLIERPKCQLTERPERERVEATEH
jgi:hypothetical protein